MYIVVICAKRQANGSYSNIHCIDVLTRSLCSAILHINLRGTTVSLDHF